MTLPIQTYNQGFFKFGPLEKCNNGELMKSTDVYAYTRSMERTLQAARTEEAASLTEQYATWRGIAEKRDRELRDLQAEYDGFSKRAITILDGSHERIDYWSELYYKGLETNMFYFGITASATLLNIILAVKLWIS